MFSVIVPVYNSEKTIIKTLNCVVPLANKGINVFISDNCSTDRTKKILKTYESVENFTIIYQKKNYGFENFLFLLEKVKTKWVLPIGSDDYLINAEILINEFNSALKNSNNVGMSFNSNFIYSNKLVADKSNVSLIGNKFKRFTKFYIFSGCNSRFYGLIRTDLMYKYFPRSAYYANDVVMSAQILEYGNWLYNKNIILHRELGLSSDQMQLRKVLDLRGFKALLPPIYFVKKLLSLSSSRYLIIKLLIILLYLRYSFSPVKHFFSKEREN